MKTIGIIGAGKMGTVVAKLAVGAGYEVYISGSGNPEDIRLTVSVLAGGAKPADTETLIQKSEAVILLLPLSRFRDLSHELLKDKLVVDAMNHWFEIDGPREGILPDDQSSSEYVSSLLGSTRVVKALNHMGYHDFHDEPKPAGHPDRKSIALAGNHVEDIQKVASLVDRLGFDPLTIGNLPEGHKLEPNGPVFGASVTKTELQQLLTS